MVEKTNPRAAALTALLLVEKGTFISTALDQVLQEYMLSSLDAALATEILYGTVRMQKAIDHLLNQVSDRRLTELDPRVRQILRIGAYQLLYLDRIPASAAVNESVKLTPPGKNRRGVAGFINAVLRNLIRKRHQLTFPELEKDPVAHIATKYSHPEWMVSRWIKRYGIDHTIKLCQINNTTPKLQVRVNTLKTDRKQLQEHFTTQGITSIPGQYAPDVLTLAQGLNFNVDPLFQNGYYYVQNESSALVAHAVAPKPGDVVYDLCAAPGGKATHIAQLMKNQGKVVAIDRTAEKVALIKENAQRLGTTIVEAFVEDAQSVTLPLADKVLIDVPCSGLGVLRHKPDARWHKREQDITVLTKTQKQILLNAARLVKPGGILVYSTCTTEPEENQEMISWFLQQCPEFRLSSLPSWFPGSSQEGMATILPFLHEIDGFFICKMENCHH